MTLPRIREPTHIGFVLLRDHSMIAFANAIDCFRMANYISRRALYRWSVITADDAPSMASNGLVMAPTLPRDAVERCDIVFVCGGTSVRGATDDNVRRLLRQCAARRTPLGALCTGSFALASAGALDGYRCAIHWENLAAIREEFPKVAFAQEVFIIDRDRYTCSGGTAPLDLMLHLIRAEHGAALARDISEQFIVERQRAAGDRQRMPMPERVGPGYQHLRETVEIMAANIEEPLPLQEIADAIHISLRQLERLFHSYLSAKPAHYYMNLRLRRARELLMLSSVPIMQITIACGFQSSSHFSKAYRAMFGYPPSAERRRTAAIA
ncbi:GlxA family transcriptional regulator [Aquincola sp. S2]|uniref:GlxA family transcriptional regulator n=1 Tax=Pseudaquabacterium terrae TaxID=2732868 RepID=A0ABX2EUR9_9BURK|nr:GlxA family transcriptional regulator [Aquabacterium terrae]NRF72284.1 GlxA family transcriptional regulator [Aquabacterium terrae]